MSSDTVACRAMLLALPPVPPAPQSARFVEVRRDASPRVDRRAGGARSAAGGLAVVDLDGDGRPDLFVGRAGGLPDRLLVRRDDGVLADEAPRFGLDVLDATLGALFVDLDGDGRRDALLFGAGLHFLRGTSDGRFEPAPESGLATPAGFDGVCTAATAADVDVDGDLDLFVATHRCAHGLRELARPFPLFDAANGPRNLFFRNEGGRFRECLDEAGLGAGATRLASDARFADLTGDAAPDLVVGNEFGRSQLFVNDGRGRFHEMPLVRGLDLLGATRFVSIGDLDGDGANDLFLGAASDPIGEQVLADDPAWLKRLAPRTRGDAAATARGGFALLAGRDGWREAGEPLGLARLGPFRGGLLADLVGDPEPELLLLDAAPADPPAPADERFWNALAPELAQEGSDPTAVERRFAEPVAAASPRAARLLTRRGGRFVDADVDLGALRGGTRALAWDFDGDGDSDLAVTGDDDFELLLLRNDGAGAPAAARPPAAAPCAHLLVVSPKVPAPALDVATLSGGTLVIPGARTKPALVCVDRGDGARAVALARERGPACAACDVVVLDAQAGDPATRDAVAAVDALVGNLVDRDAGAAIVRVDIDGLVDLLAWDAAPEEIATAAATPPAGHWLAPTADGPGDLASRDLDAGLPAQALRALEWYERRGVQGLDFDFGRVHAQLHHWKEAADRLGRVDSDSAQSGAAQLELGRCLVKLQQAGPARRAFEAAIARRPDDAAARFELGRLLVTAPDRDVADRGTESLRVATYLEPDWAAAQIWFGRGLARVGRREEAEHAFEHAIALDARDGEPHFELARVLLAEGRLDDALAHAEKSAALAPGNPTTNSLIATIQARIAAK